MITTTMIDITTQQTLPELTAHGTQRFPGDLPWLPAIWSPGMERDQSPASAAPEASDPVVPHVKCLLGLLYLYHSCGYHGR